MGDDKIYFNSDFKSFEITRSYSRFEILYDRVEHSRNLLRRVTFSHKVMKWIVFVLNMASSVQGMSVKWWKTVELFVEFYGTLK